MGVRPPLFVLLLGILSAAMSLVLTSQPVLGTTSIVVTTTADTIAHDEQCSLREAIRAANTDAASGASAGECPAGHGADTIVVPAGTYTLTLAGPGEDASLTGDLDLTSDVTIQGAGADSTIIDANSTVGTGDRVLDLAPGVMSTISNVTIRGGRTEGVGGGGILNRGSLTLVSSTVRDNGAFAAQGGGIENIGTLVLDQSTISDNSSTGTAGISNLGSLSVVSSTVRNNFSGGGTGGITTSGTATLIDSTIRDNSGESTGGISNSGTLTLTGSTVSGNSGDMNGGGISNDGTLTAANTTVSSNTSSWGGSGVDNDGTASLANVTVAQNTNLATVQASGVSNRGTVTVKNSIIAGNTIDPAGAADCLGTLIGQGYILIQSTTNCTVTGDLTGNLTGVDPHVGPLQDNGGPTLTHALLPGSPAIDAGNPAGCTDAGGVPLTTDQRGAPRPLDGNSDGMARCDLGAVEAAATSKMRRLTVSLAGGGMGVVTSSPSGIDCGTDCTEDFGHGTVVTLTASPAPGSTFREWSGACAGAGVCQVTMTSDTSVTATFATATPAAELPRTWYFAEGYTGEGFDEYLTIQNPHDQPGTATITYFLEGAAPAVRQVSLRPTSRTTVTVHQPASANNPGGYGRTAAGQGISAKVEADLGIVVERPMYFTYQGSLRGGHNVVGANAPRQSWLFAEGYTGGDFDEFLTIMNPNSTAAEITITYYLESGGPITKNLTVAGSQRRTVSVHGSAEGVGRDQAVSAQVTTTHPGGIVVERPMYFSYGGFSQGGHNVMGAAEPATSWYFPDGDTRSGADTYLTILNPTRTHADVAITYYTGEGATQVKTITVLAGRRYTVKVHEAAEGVGRGMTPGIMVASTNDVGVVVERPLYRAVGGDTVLGATAPGPQWLFAEGWTGPGFTESLVLLNPHDGAADVTLTYYLAEGNTVEKTVSVAARSRRVVEVNAASEGVGPDQAVSARVSTTHAGGIVAERAMTFGYGAIPGYHSAIGFTP